MKDSRIGTYARLALDAGVSAQSRPGAVETITSFAGAASGTGISRQTPLLFLMSFPLNTWTDPDKR